MAWWHTLGLGVGVTRAAGSLGALANRLVLFNVVAGEILLTCMYFVCTVAETGAANAIEFDITPTDGTGPTPMDNGVGDINGLVIGDIIAPQGVLTLPAVVTGPLIAGPSFSRFFICKVGTIGITKAAATDAGTWRGRLFYIPLTEGAYVVAA